MIAFFFIPSKGHLNPAIFSSTARLVRSAQKQNWISAGSDPRQQSARRHNLSPIIKFSITLGAVAD
mgnify:CR=1 FL=1